MIVPNKLHTVDSRSFCALFAVFFIQIVIPGHARWAYPHMLYIIALDGKLCVSIYLCLCEQGRGFVNGVPATL